MVLCIFIISSSESKGGRVQASGGWGWWSSSGYFTGTFTDYFLLHHQRERSREKETAAAASHHLSCFVSSCEISKRSLTLFNACLLCCFRRVHEANIINMYIGTAEQSRDSESQGNFALAKLTEITGKRDAESKPSLYSMSRLTLNSTTYTK